MLVLIYIGRVYIFPQGFYLATFSRGFSFADGPSKNFLKIFADNQCKIPTIG